MLRPALFMVGGVFIAGGALAALTGFCFAGAWLVVWGLILLIGLAIERWRYKSLTGTRPGPEWIATNERFIDPETGLLVTVYFHPVTGERRYVAA